MFELRVFLLLDWLPYQSKKSSLPYYLPIAGERKDEVILFSRVLAHSEMQTASSRI